MLFCCDIQLQHCTELHSHSYVLWIIGLCMSLILVFMFIYSYIDFICEYISCCILSVFFLLFLKILLWCFCLMDVMWWDAVLLWSSDILQYYFDMIFLPQLDNKLLFYYITYLFSDLFIYYLILISEFSATEREWKISYDSKVLESKGKTQADASKMYLYTKLH